MLLEKNKAYLIKWYDHFSVEGFFESDMSDFDISEMIVETIGYYVGENSRYWFLAHSITTDSSCADIMAIMKCAVVTDPKRLY